MLGGKKPSDLDESLRPLAIVDLASDAIRTKLNQNLHRPEQLRQSSGIRVNLRRTTVVSLPIMISVS